MPSSPAPAAAPTEAFVWTWLPGQTTPVVAGRLAKATGGTYAFNYGQSYLARPDAISLNERELPLQTGALPLLPGLSMPGCIRDASPDAWGRRVIINRTMGLTGAAAAAVDLDELTYLLESGSDRIGALDFQTSASVHTPRAARAAPLAMLLQAAENVEQGVPLTPELDAALRHGSSIGGARPKAMIEDGDKKFIAKFSASNDLYSVVKAEFIAMRLATECALTVAPVRLERALNKDVLLIERFDRERTADVWRRKALLSALTLLELDELMARHASYGDLADIIRQRFDNPRDTLRELFGRLVFNILCGNTDDHARNHAAFWDGARLSLTPAYDICPQSRTGTEANQAMNIFGTRHESQLRRCLEAAATFLLTPAEAETLIRGQIAVIRQRFDAVCDEAGLSQVDRALFRSRQFLNAYAFEGLPEEF
ncbi:type II toxin-antitoxin system HipA family toxin [Hyphomonas sp.]|uniref:type II toxin-antitoxin system HipA family toxin n=1 Tax=Hyphomonas sp. TaxID=87 RepID=UPI0033407A13